MQIHELSATELLASLEAKELSSVELIDALAQRRSVVDPLTNAFTEVLGEARDRARQADEARSKGESWGPLHGLPISVKDNLDLEGSASTLGIRSRQEHRADKDAVAVAILKDAGAIVLGKTNVPQLLLAQETENELYGVTRNPWNLERAPGGSSGGEAAAIATGQSPLGLGTDIGGSIRIPAHFCGIAGLKPTVDRWSNIGLTTAIPGQELVRAQVGPMARTALDLSTVWNAISPASHSALDPQVPPLPSSDGRDLPLQGMRIGFVNHDEFVPPVASCREACDRARAAVEEAGATVIDHVPVSSAEVLLLWLAGVSSDGSRTALAALGGEAPSPQLKRSVRTIRMPAAAKFALRVLLKRLGEGRMEQLVASLGEKSVAAFWKLSAERTALRHLEFEQWRRKELDALISPAHVLPAMPHRSSGDLVLTLGPTARWSLLDFPAGIVPSGRVTDKHLAPYQGACDDRLDKAINSVNAASLGLPLGVQVVALPYREDKVLAVMRAIEERLRGDASFPTTPTTPGS